MISIYLSKSRNESDNNFQLYNIQDVFTSWNHGIEANIFSKRMSIRMNDICIYKVKLVT